MKNIVLILLFIASGILSFYLYEISGNNYRILKIDSPVQIYVDTNQNFILDEPAPVRIDDIYFVESGKNYSNDKILSGLSEEEKFFLEYKAREYADNILRNKYVNLIDNSIVINGQNYKDTLLKSNYFYDKTETSKQNLIDNIRKLNLNDYYIYNLKSGKLHKLSCENGRKSKKYEIVYKNFKTEKSKLCGSCFSIQSAFTHKEKISPQKTPPFKSLYESNNIKIYFLDMNKIFVPSSKCSEKACVDLKHEIDSAKQSIDFAVYGINNQPEIINSLKKAKKRGIKIRWVCDFDKKDENYYPDTKKLKQILTDYNTDEEYEKSNRSAIMHNKFFVFDDKKVWTGSANITGTDLTGFNANYAALINSSDIAQTYKKEFEQMYNGKFHILKEKTDKQEITINDSTTVLPLFSPADDIMGYIIKEINNAEKYIYIPIFYITHKDLAEPLINAHNRGVDVRIINDATNAHGKYSLHKILRKNGIAVKTENYAGKMHAKAIIIDDKTAIIGSMNYTKSGNNYNDENVLVIKNKNITKYLKESFLYLWNKIPDKYLKTDPWAESFSSVGSCFDGIDNDFDGKIDKRDEGCMYKKN